MARHVCDGEAVVRGLHLAGAGVHAVTSAALHLVLVHELQSHRNLRIGDANVSAGNSRRARYKLSTAQTMSRRRLGERHLGTQTRVGAGMDACMW